MDDPPGDRYSIIVSPSYTRKFVRKHIEFPVRIMTLTSAQFISCRAKNFGAGGIGIECPVALETGQRVQVEFMLPGEKRVMQITANVRLAEKLSDNSWRAGLQFVNLSQADQIYFTNYMAGTFLLY